MTQESFWVSGEMSEDAAQKLVVDWCHWHEGDFPLLSLLYSVPNGAPMGKRAAVRFVGTGMRKGVPDLCLPVPSRKTHGLYIEMKSAKGRIRPEQADYIEALNGLGYLAVVCRDPWEAVRLILTQVVENMSSKSRKSMKARFERATKHATELFGKQVDILRCPGMEELEGFRQDTDVFVDFVAQRCYPLHTTFRTIDKAAVWKIYYYLPGEAAIKLTDFDVWFEFEEE